jgi:uncharacterized membrane protein YgcG
VLSEKSAVGFLSLQAQYAAQTGEEGADTRLPQGGNATAAATAAITAAATAAASLPARFALSARFPMHRWHEAMRAFAAAAHKTPPASGSGGGGGGGGSSGGGGGGGGGGYSPPPPGPSGGPATPLDQRPAWRLK